MSLCVRSEEVQLRVRSVDKSMSLCVRSEEVQLRVRSVNKSNVILDDDICLMEMVFLKTFLKMLFFFLELFHLNTLPP